MTDLSTLNLVNNERRMSATVAANVNAALARYSSDDLEWDWLLLPMPIQGPGGVAIQFTSMFLVTMPAPVIGAPTRFIVSRELPDILTLHDVNNVRQIVHDMVEGLRKQRADYLRTSQ